MASSGTISSERDQRNFQMLALAFNNRDVVWVECQVVESRRDETTFARCFANPD